MTTRRRSFDRRRIAVGLLFLCCVISSSTRTALAFAVPRCRRATTLLWASSSGQTTDTAPSRSLTDNNAATEKRQEEKNDLVSDFCIATNDFFKGLVIQPVKDYVQIQPAGTAKTDILSKLTAPPEVPGIPRPVWLTILGSVPTLLGWYGYYKFSVEEELFQYELHTEGKVSGFGGYGTLFPFVYGVMLGFPLSLLHNPAGEFLLQAASVWILLGQVNLYRRVNELCREAKETMELPNDGSVLWEWWALLPPPIDVVVGLRQVHFLSEYWRLQRGDEYVKDVIAQDLFPFIAAKQRFTLKEFFRTPSMWFWFTKDWNEFDFEFLQENDDPPLDSMSSNVKKDKQNSSTLASKDAMRRTLLSLAGGLGIGTVMGSPLASHAAVGSLPEYQDTNVILQGVTVQVADKSQQDAMIKFLTDAFDADILRKRIRGPVEETWLGFGPEQLSIPDNFEIPVSSFAKYGGHASIHVVYDNRITSPLYRIGDAAPGNNIAFLQLGVPQYRVSQMVANDGNILDAYGYVNVVSPAGLPIRSIVGISPDPVMFVALNCPNVAESKTFYETLGFVEQEYPYARPSKGMGQFEPMQPAKSFYMAPTTSGGMGILLLQSKKKKVSVNPVVSSLNFVYTPASDTAQDDEMGIISDPCGVPIKFQSASAFSAEELATR